MIGDVTGDGYLHTIRSVSTFFDDHVPLHQRSYINVTIPEHNWTSDVITPPITPPPNIPAESSSPDQANYNKGKDVQQERENETTALLDQPKEESPSNEQNNNANLPIGETNNIVLETADNKLIGKPIAVAAVQEYGEDGKIKIHEHHHHAHGKKPPPLVLSNQQPPTAQR